jgi:hypothetical protein
LRRTLSLGGDTFSGRGEETFEEKDVETRIEWKITPGLGDPKLGELSGEDREVKAMPLPPSLPMLGQELKRMESEAGHVLGPVR